MTSGIIVNLAIADFFLCTVVNRLTMHGKYAYDLIEKKIILSNNY